MPYEINSALERLEQNLKDLDSAKKQVEATVNASGRLQQVVSSYVESLVSVQEGLKLWEKGLQEIQSGNATAFENAIKQMETSCSEAVSLFKAKLDETEEGFENDTNGFLIKIESENGKLAEQVNVLKVLGSALDNAIKDVNGVKTLLESLSNELKDSQTAQDEVLEVIKNDVSKISNTTSNTVKGFIDEQTRIFETLHSGKDVKLQELANSILAIQQVCNDIKEKSGSIESCCQDIRSNSGSLLREALATKELNHSIINKIENSIRSNATKTEELQQKLRTSVDGIIHQSRINRWIIIAGIIRLAVLQFIAK